MTNRTSNIIEYYEDQKNKEEVCRLKKWKSFSPRRSPFKSDIIEDNITQVIICNNLTDISIKLWEELEINFNDKNTRFDSSLNKNIIKVSNMHNYNMLKNDNTCIAIPYNGVLYKSLSKEVLEYIDGWIFIQISRELMLHNELGNMDNNNITTLKEAIAFIKPCIECNILLWKQWYQIFNLNIETIIGQYKFINKED